MGGLTGITFGVNLEADHACAHQGSRLSHSHISAGIGGVGLEVGKVKPGRQVGFGDIVGEFDA